jgi:hypothetical protein
MDGYLTKPKDSIFQYHHTGFLAAGTLLEFIGFSIASMGE